MHRLTMFLAAAAVALAALALAVTATARDGADDPPGEHREHAQGEAGDDRGDDRRARDRDRDRLPDRWERRHGLSVRVKQTHRDPDRDQLDNLGELRRHTNPRDHDSDDDNIDDGEDRDQDEDRDEDEREFSGTIASFADGILTIRASNGQTVTGRVTDGTRITCEAERAARRDGNDGSGTSGSGNSGSGNSGPGNSGSGNSGSGNSGSGSGSGSSPTGEGDGSNSRPGPNSGPGREGDRRPDVPCGREVLVAGARVDEAELHSSPSGAVFTEVELDR